MVDDDPDELASDSVSDGSKGSAVVTESSGAKSDGCGELAVGAGEGGW